MEALACQEIFTQAEHRTELELVWSFMHQDEAILCPFPDRKIEALRLAQLCQHKIGPEQAIYAQAKQFQQQEQLSGQRCYSFGLRGLRPSQLFNYLR